MGNTRMMACLPLGNVNEGFKHEGIGMRKLKLLPPSLDCHERESVWLGY